MTTALLSTTYFGPVQWYQKLYRYDHILIEQHESFPKQTYRNRCIIATTQGPQALTVPVSHSKQLTGVKGTQECSMFNVQCSMFNVQCSTFNVQCSMFNVQCSTANTLLSDHGNWRHLHWQALQSAYGDSPFFEYYADDLRPFFFEHRWTRLIDFNEAIRQTICELLDIHPHVEYTTEFFPLSSPQRHRDSEFLITPLPQQGGAWGESHSPLDFRTAISPKHPADDPDFKPRRYYQVYERKHGFLPNMSILDLLFNMGPESIFYL